MITDPRNIPSEMKCCCCRNSWDRPLLLNFLRHLHSRPEKIQPAEQRKGTPTRVNLHSADNPRAQYAEEQSNSAEKAYVKQSLGKHLDQGSKL